MRSSGDATECTSIAARYVTARPSLPGIGCTVTLFTFRERRRV